MATFRLPQYHCSDVHAYMWSDVTFAHQGPITLHASVTVDALVDAESCFGMG